MKRHLYPADAWLERLRAGETLQSIGDDVGLTRERVRQILDDSPGYEDAKLAGRAARRERTERVAMAYSEELRPKIAELLRDGKSNIEAANILGIPVYGLSRLGLLGVIPDAERRTLRGDRTAGRTRISTEEMGAAIREADGVVGTIDGLSIQRYARYAQRHDLPSAASICNRFGSWIAACEAAGVSATRGPNSARRVDFVGADECVAAVALCREELGLDRIPTSNVYDAWSRGRKDVPSQVTVRKRLGGWRGVIRALSETGGGG